MRVIAFQSAPPEAMEAALAGVLPERSEGDEVYLVSRATYATLPIRGHELIHIPHQGIRGLAPLLRRLRSVRTDLSIVAWTSDAGFWKIRLLTLLVPASRYAVLLDRGIVVRRSWLRMLASVTRARGVSNLLNAARLLTDVILFLPRLALLVAHARRTERLARSRRTR